MADSYELTTPLGVLEMSCNSLQTVLEMPQKRLYHYTSRDVFWKIIEDETFLARHILFSNDSEEYEIGKNKIAALGGGPRMEKEIEQYMICFCEKDDLLSQWRGYAKHGIAMEFDFSHGMFENGTFTNYHCFTLVNNEETKKKEIPDSFEDKKFAQRYLSCTPDGKGLLTLAVTAPYRVFYEEKSGFSSELEKALNSVGDNDAFRLEQEKLIPYIKNKKFDEEQEYRLIFDLSNLFKSDRQWIKGEKNMYLDVDGVKKPNIRIEYGNASDKDSDTICVYYRNSEFENTLARTQKLLETKGISVELVDLPKEDKFSEKELILSNGKAQEQVMAELSKMIAKDQELFADVKIWCDGHLPIRRIIVGPSKDVELMCKSITQYKSNKYWMKYIEVKGTDIPFRE